MSYEALRLAIDRAGVAEVVFCRPERGNPIDMTLSTELNALSIELATNDAVRVVLLRAEGKLFSVGGDLSVMKTCGPELPRVVLELTAPLHTAIARLQRMNAPIIAAVHGVCVGGMNAFVAGCDLVIASEAARFTAAYPAIGFSCDAGSSVMVTRRMGLQRARRFFLLNETLDGKSAFAAGLVDEVVPAVQLESRARALASQLATGPTRAFGETRRLLLSAADQPLEAQLELEAQALARVASGHDAQEGVTAFLEKRAPKFFGR